MTRTPEYASIPEAGTLAFALPRQWLHLLALLLLVPICWAFAAPALGNGEWFGLSDTGWFWASVVAAALFQHAYIWVHYYCTEKPDTVLIYG